MTNFKICDFSLVFFYARSMFSSVEMIAYALVFLAIALFLDKSQLAHLTFVPFFFRSRKKSVRDSFSDFVLFKEKFWHDKSVVYHHLVGFIHFYIRSLRCHFRVFRVQFLFIFRSWASCFTSPLVCYPILLASFPLFLCVVVVVCTVFFFVLCFIRAEYCWINLFLSCFRITKWSFACLTFNTHKHPATE